MSIDALPPTTSKQFFVSVTIFVPMVDRRRQWRAENQPIDIVREISDNEFIIEGSEGDEYYVNINVPVCDCPDWEKREPNGGCKHIIKAKLKKDLLSTLPSEKTNNGQYANKTEYPGGWQKLSKQTKKRDNWTCQKCGSKGAKYGDIELHAHHIVPKSKDGADKLCNLITLCKKCHENQHGHSIAFDEIHSNNTSANQTTSENKTKRPSTSGSNVNSESGSIDAANKGDDTEERYYDVEPGLHPDSGQSWAVQDSLPPGQNIEKKHGGLGRGQLENSKSQNNRKYQESNTKSIDGNKGEPDSGNQDHDPDDKYSFDELNLRDVIAASVSFSLFVALILSPIIAIGVIFDYQMLILFPGLFIIMTPVVLSFTVIVKLYDIFKENIMS